jgi:hypothetical protein
MLKNMLLPGSRSRLICFAQGCCVMNPCAAISPGSSAPLNRKMMSWWNVVEDTDV